MGRQLPHPAGWVNPAKHLNWPVLYRYAHFFQAELFPYIRCYRYPDAICFGTIREYLYPWCAKREDPSPGTRFFRLPAGTRRGEFQMLEVPPVRLAKRLAFADLFGNVTLRRHPAGSHRSGPGHPLGLLPVPGAQHPA